MRGGKLTLGDDDKKRLMDAGNKVLELFPGRQPGACALMSAAYSWALEKLGAPPGYVVAGSLYVGDTRVFGEEQRFPQSDPSWDGHAWVICGDWLADASVFPHRRQHG
jgi:hypothetical protein